MAAVRESGNFEPDEPPELRAVEDGEDLFDPGALGSLTAEQVAVVGLAVRNYSVEEIAWHRGTQAEQVDSVFNHIRRQTEMRLSELSALMIENGMIEPPKQPPVPETEPAAESQPPGPSTLVAPAEELPAAEESSVDEIVATEPDAEAVDQPPVARQHIIDYVKWMYPKELPQGLDELNDKELARIADAALAAAIKFHTAIRPLKKRRDMKISVNYLDYWLQGYGVSKIAELTGRNDGSVRFSLEPFAERVGKTIPLDELLGQSDPSD